MWAILAAEASAIATEWFLRHRVDLSLAPSMIVLLVYALYPRIKFFENGVRIPPDESRKVRYFRWDQIERYSWDGDRLILTGTSSILFGGPVEGGQVRIPEGRRLAVEQVLSMKVAQRV